MHTKISKIAAALLTAVIATAAQAELYAVAPAPYTAQTGFYAPWYQDTHGRALDLCLSKAVNGAGQFMCALLPLEGVFDPNQPIAFPDNFPDESFWFIGEAAHTDAATGINLVYVAALEAAFGGDVPTANDQISFARIRVRVDVPVVGTYTITHPYGVEVFTVTAAEFGADGTGAINMTRDIGIGAPGTFDQALNGDIGPFLRSVNGPYLAFNPETAANETFVGDPNLLEEVTGSPFGTNFVRVEGPNGINVETRLFSIAGKLADVALPTPLIVERTTYSRTTGVGGEVAAQQDVFALAPPPEGTARVVDANGIDHAMTDAYTRGDWYGQSSNSPSFPGAQVSITADNSMAVPGSTPTTKTSPLTDLIVINSVEYSLATKQLTVTATTSDEVTPPALTASGLGALSGTGAVRTLVATLEVPPPRITVTSAHGGSDTEAVVIRP